MIIWYDYELDFKVYNIEIWLFSIMASLQKWLSTAGNIHELSEFNVFKPRKKQSLPIFLKKYYESLWIGLCIFSMKGYLNSKFQSSLEFRDRSGTYMIPQRLVPALRSSFSLVLPEESTQVHILINLKNIQSWKLLTEMQISYITVSPWFWI